MAVVLLLYLIAEAAAIGAVAAAVGVLWTIVFLLAGAFVGSWLARREGGKAMRAFLAAARSGRSGHQEITDGMLIALGGVLILVPGFVTDAVGLLMLLPPTRSLFRRAWLRRLNRTARRRNRIIVDGAVIDSSPQEATKHYPSRRDDDPPRIIDGD